MGVIGIKVCHILVGMLWLEKERELMRCNVNATVVFRLVVFRPFASEVLLARVKSSDEDGIRCA